MSECKPPERVGLYILVIAIFAYAMDNADTSRKTLRILEGATTECVESLAKPRQEPPKPPESSDE